MLPCAPFNDYNNAKGKKKVEIIQITLREGQKFPESNPNRLLLKIYKDVNYLMLIIDIDRHYLKLIRDNVHILYMMIKGNYE
jgi:hypothetical protein